MDNHIQKIDEFISEMKQKSYEYLHQRTLLILENQEYRNRKRAMRAVKQYCKELKNENDDNELIDKVNFVKQSIPYSRIAKCKFLSGLCRMVYNEDLEGEQMEILNEILFYLSENEQYIQQYNNDLNGMYFEEFWRLFEDRVDEMYKKERLMMSKMNFNTDKSYNIFKINNFQEARKYAKYCDWCMCKSQFDYDTYTMKGEVFYFCLLRGFENIDKKQGVDYPLDEYGISMIAISVTPKGRLATCTTRWNVDGVGNKSMDVLQISELIGHNFYEIFNPES